MSVSIVTKNQGVVMNHPIFLWCVVVSILGAPTCVYAQESLLTDSLLVALPKAPEDTVKVHLLNAIAWSYRNNAPKQSLDYASQAESLAEHLAWNKGRVGALNNIGFAHFRLGNFTTSIRVAMQALELSEAIFDKNNAAYALNTLGNSTNSLGDNNEGLAYHFRSLALREELGDKALQSASLGNIALVYSAQGNYDNALRYHFQALRFATEVGDVERQALLLNNIGFEFLNKNLPDSAMRYAQNAIALSKQFGFRGIMGFSSGIIGELLSKQGQYDSAMTYFQASLDLLDQLGEKRNTAYFLCKVSASLLAQGKQQEALRYAKWSFELADSISARPDKRNALKMLAEVTKMLGKYPQSLGYLERYMALNDSLVNEESSRITLQREARYEADKKDKQILLLQKDKEQQQIVRNSLIGGFMIVFFAALWLGYLYRAKHQASNEILRQQKVLEDQTAEIEVVNTQLHEMNQTLQDSNQQLQELNAEKNEFLSIAAHDLRNPLAGIQMNVGLLKKHSQTMLPEEIFSYYENISVRSQYMTAILNNLLGINVIEAGQMALKLENINVATIVQQVVRDYKERAEKKNIVMYIAPFEEFFTAFADADITQEVVDNLISNAIKYSPHGKNVVVELVRYEQYARIAIRDEGPGLSEADKKQLFAKFARLSAKPTGGENSTGLGLAIVKKLVEAMNGRVWCESEISEGLPSGATFVVELPTAILLDT